MRIRTQLVIGLSALLLASFAAINFINYAVSKASLRSNIITNSLPSISDNIYSEIQRSLLVPTQVSSLMANDTFLKDWVLGGEQDITRITRYLLEIKERYGFDTAFLVSHRSNRYYRFAGLHKIISPGDPHDIWYYDFIRRNAESDLDVDTDQAAANRLTIFINHRLTDYHGRFLGVTGVGLSLDTMGELFARIKTVYAKEVYLVDRDGLIQVHEDTSLVKRANIRDMPGIQAAAEALLSASEEPTLVEYDSPNGHMLLMVRYIPLFDWFLVVEQPQDAALAALKTNLVRNLGIGLAVTIAVIAINILLVNHFQGRLEHMAQTDELTGLHNRRHFMALGRRDFAQHQRSGKPLTLLMIDADHFKEINDHYGHEAGDNALRVLARIMAGELREADLLSRIGGEEFVALLPMTNLENAVLVAERMRKAVETQACADLPRTLTISIGVASADAHTPGLEHLIHKADAALYSAKEKGRNQVATA